MRGNHAIVTNPDRDPSIDRFHRASRGASAAGICHPDDSEKVLLPLYCQAFYLPADQKHRIPAQAVAPTRGVDGLLHYCDGLTCANRARKGSSVHGRGGSLGWAIGEMTYAITHTGADIPFQAVMRTERAKAHFLTGNSKEGMADIEEAIRVDPSYLWAYTALADYYGRAGEHASALQAIERGLAKNPGSKALQGRKASLEKKQPDNGK